MSVPLVDAGLNDAELADGWALLRKLGPATLVDVDAPSVDVVRPAVAEVEAFARRFMRALEPAVARKYPKHRKLLFEGLGARKGSHALFAVHEFIELVVALPKQPGGAATRKLLESRGLTSAEIARIRPHLATAMGQGPKEPKSKPRKQPDYAAAERAVWAWYLDWSAVARARITDGRVLRRLGFAGRSKRVEETSANGATPDG